MKDETPVLSIKIEKGIVYASDMVKPIPSSDPNQDLGEWYGMTDLYNSSFVPISNNYYQFLSMLESSGMDYKSFNEISFQKDGIYPAPENMFMTVKEELSEGWVPTYKDPDNVGCHPNAEIIKTCTISFHPTATPVVNTEDKPDFEEMVSKSWESANSFYKDGVNPHAFRLGAKAIFESLQSQLKSLREENEIYKNIDVYRSGSDYQLEINRHKRYIEYLEKRIQELQTKP